MVENLGCLTGGHSMTISLWQKKKMIQLNVKHGYYFKQ